MCARKVVKSQTPYYVFSLNPEDLTKVNTQHTFFLLHLMSHKTLADVYSASGMDSPHSFHVLCFVLLYFLEQPRSERSAQYLGKLRGNSGGTEYVLYDDGQSPDDFNGDDDGDDDGKDGKVRNWS